MIFEAIVRYKQEHDGLSPTLSELAERCSLSVSAIRYHLMRLELTGHIRWHGRRGIVVLGGEWSAPEEGQEADQMASDPDKPKGRGAARRAAE